MQPEVRNASYLSISSLLVQSMHNLETRNTSYQLIRLLFIFSLFSSWPFSQPGLVVVTLPTKGSVSTVSSAFFNNRTPIGSPVSPRRALAINLFLNFNFLRLISARTTNVIMARISNVPITAGYQSSTRYQFPSQCPI